MRTNWGLVAFALGVAACGPVPVDGNAMVAIDDSFTEEQRTKIEAGVLAWEDVVHASFRLSVQPHSLLLNAPPDDTVFIVNACATTSAVDSGTTYLDGHAARICLHPERPLADAMLQRVASHEMGHALGLQHNASTDAPRVMRPHMLDDAPIPTCADAKDSGLVLGPQCYPRSQ